MIISAALSYKLKDQEDDDMRYIVTGHRHADCYEILYVNKISYDKESVIEGFQNVDAEKIDFVDRYEAAKIAYNCHQTEIRLNILYSEDIY